MNTPNEKILKYAKYTAKLLDGVNYLDVKGDDLVQLLYDLQIEKEEKNEYYDRFIDYNDEIVEIEELEDEIEMVDITVSGDNLFYANEILTKNSYGLPMTVDGLYAIIQNEELFNAGKYLNKVLKSRFGDNINTIYTCGVDRKHMRLLDLPEDQQELPQHIKDQLNWQAQKDREKKDKEAAEDIGMTFD